MKAIQSTSVPLSEWRRAGAIGKRWPHSPRTGAPPHDGLHRRLPWPKPAPDETRKGSSTWLPASRFRHAIRFTQSTTWEFPANHSGWTTHQQCTSSIERPIPSQETRQRTPLLGTCQSGQCGFLHALVSSLSQFRRRGRLPTKAWAEAVSFALAVGLQPCLGAERRHSLVSSTGLPAMPGHVDLTHPSSEKRHGHRYPRRHRCPP